MALFEPLTLGDVTVSNRIFLAPLTRCRADLPGHIPTDAMATMYAQRASGGLLIAEATMVSPNTSAFMAEPGVYSTEQVAGWKKVTDAVHAKGGKIFLQIWNAGRVVCPLNNEDGKPPKGPSPIRVTHGVIGQFNPTGEKVEHVEPVEMTKEDISVAVGDFVKGAQNAIAAGFDGVEIHGANGYLIDQFWRTSSNKRTDNYGGSMENRARFMFEVVDGVCAAIGAGRVGIRLSPINSYNNMQDDAPLELLAYTCEELSKRKIAYLHAMRADFFQAQTGDVLGTARKHFKGPIIANMGYTPKEAEEAVASKAIDAVAFGTSFLANPDLPERIKTGAALNAPAQATFYSRDPVVGYTDYPYLA